MKSEIGSEPGRPRPRNQKPVIGLAGGIGAGKSTVAARFAKLSCLVLDSDRQAHEVLSQPDVIAELARWLGPDVLNEAGAPDRRKVAQRVFGRPDLVEKLNGLIHPRVHQMRHEAIAAAANDPAVVAVVLDTPLLFEAGVDRECDAIVFVDAPLEQRRQRVAAERRWSPDELDRRQGHQMDLDEKRRRCDFVINNDGQTDVLAGQVRHVLDEVLRRAKVID